MTAEPPTDRDLYTLGLCRAAQLGSVRAVEAMLAENPDIEAAEILRSLRSSYDTTDRLFRELTSALTGELARNLLA